MTYRYKICLFAVKLFENHGIKVDRAELLSLSVELGYDGSTSKETRHRASFGLARWRRMRIVNALFLKTSGQEELFCQFLGMCLKED